MSRRTIQNLVYGLLFLLVFEGLVRRFLPGAADRLFFFGKDMIAFALAFMVMERGGPPRDFDWLVRGWIALGLALIPPFLLTSFHSVPLAIFGAKQYVLFPAIAVGFGAAFPVGAERAFRAWITWFAILVIPTTAVAVIQLTLPPTHPLNLTVGGTDMSGFSGGGNLRVSSTFSFVAQYNMFLNALLFGLGAYLVLGPAGRPGRWVRRIPRWVFIAAYIVGLFITGSRQSVLGTLAMFVVATGLVVLGNRRGPAKRLAQITVAVVVVFIGARFVFPEAFVAYDARAGDAEKQVEHVGARLSHALFSWTDGVYKAPDNLFGYGLGVMSNGSWFISDYAEMWRRDKNVWGEVDLANTMFEGGWWLVVAWMGFRFYTILMCARTTLRIRYTPYFMAAACATGTVTVTGVFGQMGIQPPLSCWFWMAVGAVICLRRFDRRRLQEALEARENEAGEVSARAPGAVASGSA